MLFWKYIQILAHTDISSAAAKISFGTGSFFLMKVPYDECLKYSEGLVILIYINDFKLSVIN